MNTSRSLSQDEATNLARLGLEDPGFFCRTFLPDWFSLQMPWFHRGVMAILTRKTDWLLKFGEETWPKEKAVWKEEDLENILRYFVWRSDPEDERSPLIPLFEAERSNCGKLIAIHLYISDKILLIAPRGVSKTTLVNAAVVRDVVYKLTDFIVYLSESAEAHAEIQLGNVKRQFEVNAMLQTVFGLKKPDRSSSEKWRQDIFQTTDGVVVAARGRGGQVRGLNFDGKRPTKIIFDDVEDKESVQTEPQRDKARTWLKSDVEPALPQIESGQKGQLIGLGTILHHDALLVNLSRDPEWITLRFGSVRPGGDLVNPRDEDMLWPKYMTAKQYSSKRRSFKRIGKLSEFNMEYNSSIKQEDDGAKFKSESIRYEICPREEFPGVALVVDPAISEKKGSDYCAFAVVGMSPKGRIHVFDFFAEQGMSPRAQVDKYFELNYRWKPNKHGVEAIAYQQALVHLLQEEMFRKAKEQGPTAYFEVTPIRHGKTGKIARVEGILAPRYSAGYVTHQRRFILLEEQLTDWPNAKLDGPDVVAMCVSLLDPFAAFAFDAENDNEDRLAADQFEPLEVAWGAP